MDDYVFPVVSVLDVFERMRLDVVVDGISWDCLMIKLKHADKSWRRAVE